VKKPKEVPGTARLVRHGAYQYVLLPKGFEFGGDRVQISKQGRAVLLEPAKPAMTATGKGSGR
jgi:virulence-associated protein VagC